jgi:hypothetical protein
MIKSASLATFFRSEDWNWGPLSLDNRLTFLKQQLRRFRNIERQQNLA